MTLDRWAAEQCGVAILGGGWRPRGYAAPLSGQWTLQDARCREIVREHFKVCTVKHTSTKPDHDWQANSDCGNGFVAAFGKTIAEAELACIQAIRGSDEL